MASQSNNHRQPSAERPYKPQLVAPHDLPYKVCSWLAIIFSAQSLANVRNIENDLKQISMAMMFGIMGLVTNYTRLNPRSSQKSKDIRYFDV